VSSILKALKKLEQESGENTGAPLTKGSTGRPKRRPGFLVVPGLIAFTLCIFLSVGIFIYTRNTSVFKSTSPESPAVLINDESPVLPEKIPEEKTPPQSRAAEVDIRKPASPVKTMPEFEFATADTSIKDQQQANEKVGVREMPGAQSQKVTPERLTVLPGFDYATAPVKQADPFTPIMPEPDILTKTSMPVEDSPAPPEVVQPDVSAVEPSVPTSPTLPEKTFAAKPVVKKTEPPVAVIENPAVELQAISWSADPDKRMAIINGRICREKDRVAGYVIQSINSGDVVVSKGAVKGKLVFEIR